MTVLNGRHVLVVEDEVIVALNVESELQMAGATVIGPAYTLAEALALADAPMNGAVLDINIGDEKVWPLADALRQRGVPFVFASANCGLLNGGLERFPEVLCVDKPIDFRRLVDALAELIGGARR